jgi:hypothetical protein
MITPPAENTIKQIYLIKYINKETPARSQKERFVQLMGEDEKKKKVVGALE